MPAASAHPCSPVRPHGVLRTTPSSRRRSKRVRSSHIHAPRPEHGLQCSVGGGEAGTGERRGRLAGRPGPAQCASQNHICLQLGGAWDKAMRAHVRRGRPPEPTKRGNELGAAEPPLPLPTDSTAALLCRCSMTPRTGRIEREHPAHLPTPLISANSGPSPREAAFFRRGLDRGLDRGPGGARSSLLPAGITPIHPSNWFPPLLAVLSVRLCTAGLERGMNPARSPHRLALFRTSKTIIKKKSFFCSGPPSRVDRESRDNPVQYDPIRSSPIAAGGIFWGGGFPFFFFFSYPFVCRHVSVFSCFSPQRSREGRKDRCPVLSFLFLFPPPPFLFPAEESF